MIAAPALIPISILPVLARGNGQCVVRERSRVCSAFGQLVIAAWFWRQPNDLRAPRSCERRWCISPTVLVTLMLPLDLTRADLRASGL